MVDAGFIVFDENQQVASWAASAHQMACEISADPSVRRENLRHGETWFVGVDALPNQRDGSLNGVSLEGPWQDHVTTPDHWHPAQLSIVYPGYPKQDPDESDANHRYRVNRHAAHVDGLLPVGPARRRYLQEPHAFILGLPLNLSNASPLVVWPGSHRVMGNAFRALIGTQNPTEIDLTEGYQAARRQVFESIEPQRIELVPGQTVLLHRHLLHGVAPWQSGDKAPPEGRMIAYFRPQFSSQDWLVKD